ncbi:MAG TPA: superoxide dismutase [Conexivisphaerales archaeon]|nr:superoxide dismutase [Conexivisphaerales archaeon]
MSEPTYKAKQFKLEKELKGISKKTNEEHYKLYNGYVNKWNEILDKLKTSDKTKAAGTYSEYSELKRQETFNANGTLLHDIFFSSLWGDGNPHGDMVKKIEADFGSFDNWKADMTATAVSARGWAVTALVLPSNKLHNFLVDFHNQGAVWNTIPLVALDVFEHAYYLDYQTNRKAYLEAFYQNLDWGYVEKRFQFAKKAAEIYNSLGL